jgi:hypothetical protein
MALSLNNNKRAKEKEKEKENNLNLRKIDKSINQPPRMFLPYPTNLTTISF